MKLTFTHLGLVATLIIAIGHTDSHAEETAKPPVGVPSHSPEMEKAIAEARASVGEFIEALQENTGKGHSIKAGVKDGDKVEHLWLHPVRYEKGTFVGRVRINPYVVKSVRSGSEVSVKENAISDWGYVLDGKMIGGFTDKAARAAAKPAKAGAGDGKGIGKHELVGEWTVVATDTGNGPRPSKNVVLDITSSSLTVVAPNGDRQKMGTIRRIDSSSKPKQIDIEEGGEVGLGIYELGDGTALLLIRNPGNSRARTFEGAEKGMLFMLQRKEE